MASWRRKAPERTSPAADLLPVQRQATPAYRVVRLLALPLLHLLFRIRVSGRAHIPRSGAYVIVANHLNWLDSFALLATFPIEPRIHFLGDTTMLVTHRVQWAIIKAVGGYIPVNRSLHQDAALFHHVNRCLQAGGAVALYPEGHYGEAEGTVMPFKKGFAHFALDNDVPVVPVGMAGMKDLWLRKTVSVTIGPAIAPAGRSIESLVTVAQAAVQDLIPPYVEPDGPKLFRRRLTSLF
ncbi:MAG: 1-acyl-sn-glycerol-3-phosphate acyltransferase [Candidatus Dormibacteraeota bacterium]|nr:1-acyl-sn-glycerol-3-phosphate acyltransferase [Candidatus Dormibacteraeota bacterium]